MIESIQPRVGIVMGSQSDWQTMQYAVKVLKEFAVPHEVKIISAHRTPQRLAHFARQAHRKFALLIAGAGGSAHLPGMLAAETECPVLGVPVESRHLRGLDSLLSIVQMPKGVPVACLAIGQAGAYNAGLLAVSILARDNEELRDKWRTYRQRQTSSVPEVPDMSTLSEILNPSLEAGIKNARELDGKR